MSVLDRLRAFVSDHVAKQWAAAEPIYDWVDDNYSTEGKVAAFQAKLAAADLSDKSRDCLLNDFRYNANKASSIKSACNVRNFKYLNEIDAVQRFLAQTRLQVYEPVDVARYVLNTLMIRNLYTFETLDGPLPNLLWRALCAATQDPNIPNERRREFLLDIWNLLARQMNVCIGEFPF